MICSQLVVFVILIAVSSGQSAGEIIVIIIIKYTLMIKQRNTASDQHLQVLDTLQLLVLLSWRTKCWSSHPLRTCPLSHLHVISLNYNPEWFGDSLWFQSRVLMVENMEVSESLSQVIGSVFSLHGPLILSGKCFWCFSPILQLLTFASSSPFLLINSQGLLRVRHSRQNPLRLTENSPSEPSDPELIFNMLRHNDQSETSREFYTRK